MTTFAEGLRSKGKILLNFHQRVQSFVRSNWKSLLAFVSIVFILCYFIGFLWTFLLFLTFFIYSAYQLCDQLLYNPDCPKDSRTKVLTPNQHGVHDYETHYIITEDNVRLHTILLKRASLAERSTLPTFLYLHGNAGNIGHRLPNAIELFHQVKCNILMLEYRGYGLSNGTPSESGLYRDVQAGLKFLYSRHDISPSKIVLFGRSLGGAVAIGVAFQMRTQKTTQDYQAAALIAENTFTSIPDISRHLCAGRSRSCFARLFRIIPNWFYKNRYESQRKLAEITMPTLFISGLADELIPSDMMTKLFNSSAARYKELHKFEAGNHNFTWKCAQYYSTIDRFLENIFEQIVKNADNEASQIEPQNESISSNEKSPLISGEESFQVSVTSSKNLNRNRVVYHSEQYVQGEVAFANSNFEQVEIDTRVSQMLDPHGCSTHISMGSDSHDQLVQI